MKKKSGFLNKALRPRSLRSLAPPTAFGCWNNLCMEGFQKMKLKIREILNNLSKFIYSKNATNFCKISTIDFVGFLRIYELYLPCFWRICDIITGLPVAYCGFSFSSQMKGGLAKMSQCSCETQFSFIGDIIVKGHL